MERYLYKLLIVLIIIVNLFMFIITAPVQASKMNSDQFYYTGTTKGTYSVTKSLGEWLFDLLAQIVDYILGLMTMGVRMVFIGWTAVFEMILTDSLKATVGEEGVEVESTSINANSKDNVTIESIIFNRVPILDVNIFNFDYIKGYTGTGQLIETEEDGEIVEPGN